jgi:hypothetical protein
MSLIIPITTLTRHYQVAFKMGMPQKLWISLQGYLFPLMTTSLVTLGWQFYLHPQHILRTKNYAEAAALFVRLLLWSIFITPYFGLLGSMGVYLAYTWIASNYIFINFAVSHTHLPVVEKADTQVLLTPLRNDFALLWCQLRHKQSSLTETKFDFCLPPSVCSAG